MRESRLAGHLGSCGWEGGRPWAEAPGEGPRREPASRGNLRDPGRRRARSRADKAKPRADRRRTSGEGGRWPPELRWVGPRAEQARAACPAGPHPVCLLEKQAPCPHGPAREPPAAGFVPRGWNQREPGCLQPWAPGPRCPLGQEKKERAGHWPRPAGAASHQPGPSPWLGGRGAGFTC